MGNVSIKKGKFCQDFISFKRKSDSTAFKICRSKLFHPSVTSWASWKGRKKSVWRLFPWRQGTEQLKMICSWAQVKAEQMHMIKAALTWTGCLKLRYPYIPSHRRHALSIHFSFRSRKTGKNCYKPLRVGFWPYCDRKSCGSLLTQLLDCNPHNQGTHQQQNIANCNHLFVDKDNLKSHPSKCKFT